MRNSSHNPGCMRALPASQSCQVRSVDEMSAAAAVCESPASSLACRISDGVGLAGDGMAGEILSRAILLDDLLGKAGCCISRCFGRVKRVSAISINASGCGFDEVISRGAYSARLNNGAHDCADENSFAGGEDVSAIGGGAKHGSSRRKGFGKSEGCLNRVFEGGHDLLQLIGLRRATHEPNYTRNPCISKRFLQKFNEALTPTHNASGKPTDAAGGRSA